VQSVVTRSNVELKSTDYFTMLNFPSKLLPFSGCFLNLKIINFVRKLIWTRILKFTKKIRPTVKV
jgi:hypothetical protein